ncbi:putative myosin-1 [Cladorrhinum sp. PSN332]|nr:putative myosin-1 [Cladorrhinum sp. PSN332]
MADPNFPNKPPRDAFDSQHTSQYEHISHSHQTSQPQQTSQSHHTSHARQQSSSNASGVSHSSSASTNSSTTNSNFHNTGSQSTQRASFLRSASGGSSSTASLGSPSSPGGFDRNSGAATPFQDLLGRLTPAPPAGDVDDKIKPAQDDIGKLEQETRRNHALTRSAKTAVERRFLHLQEKLAEAKSLKASLEAHLGKAKTEKQNLETKWQTLNERHREMTSQKESLEVSYQQRDAELEKRRDLERQIQQLTAEMENLGFQMQRLTDEKIKLVQEGRERLDEIQTLQRLLKERDDELAEAESNHNRTVEAKNQALLSQENMYEQVIREKDEAIEAVVREWESKYDAEVKESAQRWESQSKTLQEWQRKCGEAITEKKEGVEYWESQNREVRREYLAREEGLRRELAELEEQYTHLCAKTAQQETEQVEFRRTQKQWEEKKSEYEEEVRDWQESYTKIETTAVKKEEELAALGRKYTECYEEYRAVKKVNDELQAQSEKWQGDYGKLREEFAKKREQWEAEHKALHAQLSEQQEKWEAGYQMLEAQHARQQAKSEGDYEALLGKFKEKEDECQRLSKCNTDLDLEYQAFKTHTHEWRRKFEESHSQSVEEEVIQKHFSTNEAMWAEDLAKLHLNENGWERMYRNLVAALENPGKALAHLVVQLEANNQLLETITFSDDEDDYFKI